MKDVHTRPSRWSRAARSVFFHIQKTSSGGDTAEHLAKGRSLDFPVQPHAPCEGWCWSANWKRDGEHSDLTAWLGQVAVLAAKIVD